MVIRSEPQSVTSTHNNQCQPRSTTDYESAVFWIELLENQLLSLRRDNLLRLKTWFKYAAYSVIQFVSSKSHRL